MKNFVISAILFFYLFSLFGQKIETSYSKYQHYVSETKSDTITCIRYSILNTDSINKLVILFSRLDISEISKEKAVYRSILTRHHDFQLSMLAWESYLIVQDSIISEAPYLFVKLLDPEESFDIIFQTKTNILCSSENFGRNNILLVPEDFFLKTPGLTHFVEGVEEYHFSFPYQYIVINCDDFLKFIKQSEK